MISLVNANGDLLKITPENIYQGSNNANDLTIIAPFPASSIVYIGFELPSTVEGTQTEFMQMDNSFAISDELNTWRKEIPLAITQYYGTVKYQYKATNQSGDIIATGRGQFEVKRGVDVDLPDEPTADVYTQILQALSQVYADFINKVDIEYDDTANSITQQVINTASGLGLQRTKSGTTYSLTFENDGIKINGNLIGSIVDIANYIFIHNESEDAHQYIQTRIDNIINGTTPIELTATNASNVTETINDVNISDIFENDGVTAKNATKATHDADGNDIAETYQTKSNLVSAWQQLTDNTHYPSEKLVKDYIDNKISSVYKYKGSVATFADLPTQDLTIGDVYNVEDTGENFAWAGTEWDDIGGTIDLSNYYTKSEIDGQFDAVEGDIADLQTASALVQQVDMTAILEGNKIKAYLDDTLIGFTFEHSRLYKFNIVLPLALLTLDLPNSYVLELYDTQFADSETANKIVINNVFHISNLTSATVGDMCSLQNYNINTGVDWVFNGRYVQFDDGGNTRRVVYTSDVVRESNTAMTGADLYVSIVNNSLKTGTSVFCLTDYSNGTVSYNAGTMYKITGEVVGGDLIIDAEEMHDMTREDISHKKSTIVDADPSTTDYPNEYAVVNYAMENFVSVNTQTLTDEQKAQARSNIGAGSAAGINTYDDIPDKPILNTNNTASLSVNGNETIVDTINLHKIAKTGSYSDLNNKPSTIVLSVNGNSGVVTLTASDVGAPTVTEMNNAINSAIIAGLGGNY